MAFWTYLLSFSFAQRARQPRSAAKAPRRRCIVKSEFYLQEETAS